MNNVKSAEKNFKEAASKQISFDAASVLFFADIYNQIFKIKFMYLKILTLRVVCILFAYQFYELPKQLLVIFLVYLFFYSFPFEEPKYTIADTAAAAAALIPTIIDDAVNAPLITAFAGENTDSAGLYMENTAAVITEAIKP